MTRNAAAIFQVPSASDPPFISVTSAAGDTTTLTTVRRLKLLVAVLVLSNCLLGIFSVFLLRKLDRDYSDLIDETLPLMSQVRLAGHANTDAYSALATGLVAKNPKLCAVAAQRAQLALRAGHAARSALTKSAILRQKPELLRELGAAAADFEAVAGEIIPQVAADVHAASEPALFARLEAALQRCRAINRQLLDYVNARGQKISDDFSAEVRTRSVVVMGVAAWPLLLGVTITVVMAVVLIGMIIVFRRIGADDGP